MHTPSPKLCRAARNFMKALRAEYDEASVSPDGEFIVEFKLEEYGEDFMFKSKTSACPNGIAK